MARADAVRIPDEVRCALRQYRKAAVAIIAASAVLNVLVLGGSIYMMMVYDSVLPSHSTASLFGLLIMLVIVFVFQGAFENLRSAMLSNIAASLDRTLFPRVQRAVADMTLIKGKSTADGQNQMRDLEYVRSWLAGGGPATLIDLPWIIFFIGILMLIHVWIGVTALIGGAALVALTVVANRVVEQPTLKANQASASRSVLSEASLRHIETLSALGMRSRMLARWQAANQTYLVAQQDMARSVAVLGVTSRMGRMLLQSVILTVGALLVIRGEATGGVIFASSILSARALAPVDQAIAQWRSLASARLGWRRICELLSSVPPAQEVQTVLPAPARSLEVEQLYVLPPGSSTITVEGADFRLDAGDALAIVGPSAAGKSSLGRALLGVWPPLRGSVRLDGAALDQYAPDLLGRYMGYLPQAVELMDATVAANIARFDPDMTSEAVVRAAQLAGVHDMILALPNGYETQVGFEGRNLSAGQQQRIGLARALYGDPFLVVLDEPNSNLDAEGDEALSNAIAAVRERGGIVIVIAHRPSALSNVNMVMFMRGGRVVDFGARGEVLQRVLRNPPQTLGDRSTAANDEPRAAMGGR